MPNVNTAQYKQSSVEYQLAKCLAWRLVFQLKLDKMPASSLSYQNHESKSDLSWNL
ncbi:hypothetical protein PSPO_a0729 [Pseudoalteromonas spongiae UST010723-006]|nr:hypothetical protein PSPO_a0729 [Pseudoalteromonas spongiae UST010723-006]